MGKKKNFALGYSLIVHSFITYLFTCFFVVGLGNVVFPTLSQKLSVTIPQILTINTIGGVVAGFLAILIGQWVLKKGPKQATVVGFIAGGLACISLGYVSTLGGLVISLLFCHLTLQAYCFMSTNTIIGNWFPSKKGVILGITTIGLAIGNSTIVPLFSIIAGKTNFQTALLAMGIIMIILGIISIFWIKETPQEIGLFPDNKETTQNVTTNYISNWTLKKLLKNKSAWLVTLSYGLMFMACIGAVSQLVLFCVSRNFSVGEAVAIMAAGGIASTICSFLSGVVDQKWGTKKASVIYFILSLIVYIILAVVTNKTIIIICAIMVVGLNGAPGNLSPSMIMTKFGAKDFASVNRLITPIVMVLRSMSYWVVGIAIAIRGIFADIYVVLTIITIVAFIMLLAVNAKKVEVAPND